jgi:hypothetical protein
MRLLLKPGDYFAQATEHITQRFCAALCKLGTTMGKDEFERLNASQSRRHPDGVVEMLGDQHAHAENQDLGRDPDRFRRLERARGEGCRQHDPPADRERQVAQGEQNLGMAFPAQDKAHREFRDNDARCQYSLQFGPLVLL